ncbi:MAG TPA: hypothetical protein VGM05_21380 [Planctomycetaceae bacterium]
MILTALAHKSCWFMVMPLPDDEYGITVREESAELLDQLIQDM